uniref:FLZ-type domain-containing protein n=1 Tax=Oryza punctata TaxID=4537 RepID=A0A0E0K5B2_ORYPU
MSGKMLGKRQRSQGTMHRTTSMASVPAAAKQGRRHVVDGPPQAPPASLLAGNVGVGAGGGPAAAAAAQRRIAADHAGVETAAFLKNCALCGRDLGPGKDTYIYRGEVAFCSKECRECVIEYYERKERNCSLTSIKDTPTVSGASGSDQSGSGSETVAAA